MKLIGAAVGAVIVAGCAAPIPIHEARQIALRTPDWELCYVAVSGRGQPTLRQAVYEVMQLRRTDCNQHAALVQAKLNQDAQASAAQTAAGLQLLQASRPRPAPMPQPTYCRSVVVGNGVNTVCD